MESSGKALRLQLTGASEGPTALSTQRPERMGSCPLDVRVRRGGCFAPSPRPSRLVTEAEGNKSVSLADSWVGPDHPVSPARPSAQAWAQPPWLNSPG